MIKIKLESLLYYGLFHEFYKVEDMDAMRGSLCDYLKVPLYDAEDVALPTEKETLAEILSSMTKWAFESGLITSPFPPYSDLFDTALMGRLCPKPSEVTAHFQTLYNMSPQLATNWYYDFSKRTNYIRMERMAKNVIWEQPTAYGDMIMTINLSKPEKDPKAIAEAATMEETHFPKCLLCVENVGYAGTLIQPARQNHRVIPLTLADEPWVLQYSPYIYYNEHAIVINKEHVPMVISRDTYVRLCDFVSQFEHYFIGSNADLPLVGGSMLTHDHYQAGCFDMPMAQAKEYQTYVLIGYESVQVSWLNWPLTVLRLKSADRVMLIDLATRLTEGWRGYTSEEDQLFSHTGDEPHHTVTPIVRKRQGLYEIDVVLRDNRRSEQYPDGIFHPHVSVHPVKKENIGLIEVMGLAVLPSRLKETQEVLAEALKQSRPWATLADNPAVAGFEDIYKRLEWMTVEGQTALQRIQHVMGQVFVEGLAHSGVMGVTADGVCAMERFITYINHLEEN